MDISWNISEEMLLVILLQSINWLPDRDLDEISPPVVCDCGSLCNVLYIPLHLSVFAIREIKASFVLLKLPGILSVILMQHLIRSSDSWRNISSLIGTIIIGWKNRQIKIFRHLIQLTMQNCQKIPVSTSSLTSHWNVTLSILCLPLM